MPSNGSRFRELVQTQQPLLLVGAVNAMCGLLAKDSGFKALYLSGAGLANADFALPDLGLTSLDNVLELATKIISATDLPLLIDGDTGWGSVLNIAYSVQQLEKINAAGVHFEDQVFPKRCGHRGGKILAPVAEMVDRIKAAVDARVNPEFVIMARTDAANVDGIDAAIMRAESYVRAGADMIFAEAVSSLPDYHKFCRAMGHIPVLANITEFGITPLFTAEELQQVGIKIVLYPLTAFRAMNYAASVVYETILQQGTQRDCISTLQTREELYSLINYNHYESLISKQDP